MSRATFAAWLVAFFLAAGLAGEEGLLKLQVSDTSGRPLAGIWLELAGDGAPAQTNAGGKARLALAEGTKSGAWVSLQVRPETAEDWVFISPWDGRVRVPPFAVASDFTPIVLGRREDRSLLESSKAVEAMTRHILEELDRREKQGGEITEAERHRVLKEQAEKFGLAARGKSAPRSRASHFSPDPGAKSEKYREYFEIW